MCRSLKLISLCSGKRQGLYAVDRRMDRELHCERKRMAGYVPAAFSIRSKCKTFSLVEIDLEQEVMRVALTPKQERFVQEYLVDLNATAAADMNQLSGYAAKIPGMVLIALL